MKNFIPYKLDPKLLVYPQTVRSSTHVLYDPVPLIRSLSSLQPFKYSTDSPYNIEPRMEHTLPRGSLLHPLRSSQVKHLVGTCNPATVIPRCLPSVAPSDNTSNLPLDRVLSWCLHPPFLVCLPGDLHPPGHLPPFFPRTKTLSTVNLPFLLLHTRDVSRRPSRKTRLFIVYVPGTPSLGPVSLTPTLTTLYSSFSPTLV